jgi:hypothetical protein
MDPTIAVFQFVPLGEFLFWVAEPKVDVTYYYPLSFYCTKPELGATMYCLTAKLQQFFHVVEDIDDSGFHDLLVINSDNADVLICNYGG